MKTISLSIIISFFALMTEAHGQTQPQTVEDSITFFYNNLLDTLAIKYLKRDQIDWKKVKTYTLKQALEAQSFEQSLKTASQLFDTIGCNHCELFAEKSSYKSTLNKPLSAADFSEEFIVNLEKKSSFDFNVKLINQDIGYINMPGMLLINLSQDSLNLITQKMYDQIIELKQKEAIRGWVIDLRFNIGGNAYAMLTALYDLLGDNIVYNTIDIAGEQLNTNQLKGGGFYSGEALKCKVKVSTTPDLETPVALIIGKMTGSAGEDIAVAFKNRTGVTFIGEPTYGFLTGNDMFKLPFELQIALTLSYIADVDNKYRERILPDIEIIKKDNFTDLTQDERIIRASVFFDTIKKQ